jgi:hypothetical protein
MRTLTWLCSFLPLIAGTGVASADMITVPNFSFESPETSGVYAVTGTAQGAPTNGGTNAVPDWTFVNNEWAGTYDGFVDAGSRTAFINVNNGSGNATITSAPVTTILADTNYILTVAVGNPPGTGAPFADPGTAVLNLLANTTLAPTVFSIVATNSALHPISTANIPDGTYKDFNVDLTAAQATALAGDQLEIQMATTDGSSGQFQITFDNVRLDAVAPEPSTYAMLFGGVGLLVLVARFRGKLTA